ncbi:MAG: vitamin K epoxide reductase family protein [Anaerolineales bacterium]
MKLLFHTLILGSVLLVSLLSPKMLVHGEEPIVHAVLFYSPSCPHCHKVVTEDLTLLVEKYGEKLFILAINTYTEKGQELYQVAIRPFQIPSERQGVPTLIVGRTVLVGSYEIPQQFPGLLEDMLAEGGVDWPDIPGLHNLVGAVINAEAEDEFSEAKEVDQDPQPKNARNKSNVKAVDKGVEKRGTDLDDDRSNISELDGVITTTETLTLEERFMRDKTGNTISVLVFIGMIFSLVWVAFAVHQSNPMPRRWPKGTIPMLFLIGLAVAIYMGYVEITQSDAVCGPVGDCNTVQQSPYAYLFGIIPIGALGVVGYLIIGIVWLFTFLGPASWRKVSTLGLWGFSLFGTLFSIYLTFLEPFVIGATCAWCLTSAVVMTLLLCASTACLTPFNIFAVGKVIGSST